MSERSMSARAVPEGLRAFLATEVAGTSFLLAATVAGLLWANSPWPSSYTSFWETSLSISLGDSTFSLDLLHWVNDGLMTLFFFVVGLEISREFVVGQLRDRRLVAVPAIAALGGIAVPALIFTLINHGGAGASGWGIPMASDTAFVLGLMAIVGARCPEPLRAYLLTLSVVDDVVAILIVAIFYTEGFSPVALLIAVLFLLVIIFLRKLRIWRAPLYIMLGLGMWVATLKSGVHPTLAGIALGLLVNVYAPNDYKILRAGELVSALGNSPSPELAREAVRSVQRVVSINERLQLMLHPWTSYVIVPLFALANAGVRLDGPALRDAATSPVTIGIVVALVCGKFIGITLGSWVPLRLNLGYLPGNLVWGQLLGGAAVSGIGFTVALFVTDLAFTDPVLKSEAKIGIITGSLLAALLGFLVFRLAWNRGAVCAPPSALPPEEVYHGPLLDAVSAFDHARGPDSAPVTIVEYGDYECPYCGKAHLVLASLREEYGDRLRLVFRHLPLRELHPHAHAAALVAESAADSGVFWEMHDLLFDNQRALTDVDLGRYASSLGVDAWADLDRHARRIAHDEASASRNGVQGTPTFFINGEPYEGAHDVRSMSAAIDAALVASRALGK